MTTARRWSAGAIPSTNLVAFGKNVVYVLMFSLREYNVVHVLIMSFKRSDIVPPDHLPHQAEEDRESRCPSSERPGQSIEDFRIPL